MCTCSDDEQRSDRFVKRIKLKVNYVHITEAWAEEEKKQMNYVKFINWNFSLLLNQWSLWNMF